ncbi:MAG TPA: hypothetical protein QF446_13050 [Planctomycetota bacterium]|jgi:hypothetical protein|nr:hypothetical protein [Planctomycetota bacterium]
MNHGETITRVNQIHTSANSARRRDRVLGTVLWLGFLALLFLR